MTPEQFWSLAFFVFLMIGVLLTIPLNRELKAREDARKRNQARPWNWEE